MSHRRILHISVGFFGLIALVLLAYVGFGRTADGLVPEGVSAAGIDLSGMDASEASTTLLTYEDALVGTPLIAQVGADEVVLDPISIDLRIDKAASVDNALAVATDEGFLKGFLTWLGVNKRDVDIAVELDIDEAALDAQFSTWDVLLLTEDAIGGIQLSGTTPSPVYAAPGTRIERFASRQLMMETLATIDRSVIQLPTEIGPPMISDEAVDTAFATASSLLSAPIKLEDAITGSSLTLSPGDLAAAFVAETIDGNEPYISISLDPEIMDELFAPIRAQFADTFQDARFEVDENDQVKIIPGVSGPKVRTDVAIEQIFQAAKTPNRVGSLPLENSAEPDITEEDLAGLGVEHLVSKFTTYHDCCANRVENIHTMANTVDVVIVMPGEEFSLNGYVGERTPEKGYLPAGTIINGEIVDTVGGGVSQFATTFYNAVFWGGYTDVTHKPHSFYFSRYPEGIEATINWPNLDLAFRNDADHAILIKVDYTETSLTVKFFGDNGGQAVGGEQRGGETITWIESEGTGVVITGDVSGRYNFTPASTQYETDSSMTPGETRTKQSGGQGWSVTVTRTRTFPDGTVETDEWVARYVAKPTILVVHPCSVPGSTAECPDTTPTTVIDTTPTSPTTTPAPTTTTVPVSTTTVTTPPTTGTTVATTPSTTGTTVATP